MPTAEEYRAIQERERAHRRRIINLAATGVALLITAIIASCSINVVDVGHVGVKVRLGAVQGEAMPEGLYFVNPITTSIEKLDARVQKWEGETQAYTRDVQQATVNFVLNYRLDPMQAHVVLREVGTGWADKLVSQVLHEDVKREFGQHNAVDIVYQRDAAARSIEARIRQALERRHVLVTNFQLTNINFTEKFEHSVEEKVVAEQEAIREQNRTVQIEELAKQKVATAKGQAEATVLQAKAEAESIEIRGRALEKNPRLVELVTAEKWNGQLPTYMLGGAVPFINVPGEKK